MHDRESKSGRLLQFALLALLGLLPQLIAIFTTRDTPIVKVISPLAFNSITVGISFSFSIRIFSIELGLLPQLIAIFSNDIYDTIDSESSITIVSD